MSRFVSAQDVSAMLADGEEIAFEVDPFRKHCLLEGLDDIGITLQSDDKISSFEENQRRSMPWMQGARV